MPFDPPYNIDFITGHMIYGWGLHRAGFSKKYPKQIGEKRYMEDYGVSVKSATDFGAALQTHSKYKTAVDRSIGPSWTDKDAAQKCKGGLWWATRNGIHVHFYLGGLDMDMVTGSGGAKNKGITCRELRWLNRFKDDSQVKLYIQFWRPVGITTFDGLKTAQTDSNAERCAPPWDDAFFAGAATKWGAYAPKREHDINGVHI